MVKRTPKKTKSSAKTKVAVKKSPAKPKPTAKRSPATKTTAALERGVALVERAIAADRKAGGTARAVPAATLAKLAMPDGRALPPSLATWLAYDHLGVVEKGKLAWRSFGAMLAHEFDAQTAAMFEGFEKLLPGQCLAFSEGSDSRRFLYAGEADASGEYPVIVVDTDETPWVCLAYPGFDAYIADGRVAKLMTGTYESVWDRKAWQPALVAQARANFGGFKSFGFQDSDHLDGDGDQRALTLLGLWTEA